MKNCLPKFLKLPIIKLRANEEQKKKLDQAYEILFTCGFKWTSSCWLEISRVDICHSSVKKDS